MPNLKNTQSVQDLKEKVAKAKSIVFAEFQGLKANQANDFRAKMLEHGAEVSVAKNTLLKKAMQEEKIDVTQVESVLKSTTLAIFSYKDALTPLKAIYEFGKKLELPKVKASIIDGIFTTADQTKVLSQLPSKEQLIAQALAGLKSPITGFVNVLGGTRSKFVYALSAIAKKKA